MMRAGTLLLFIVVVSNCLFGSNIFISHYNINAEIFPAEHLLKAKAVFTLKNLSDQNTDKVDLQFNTDEIEFIRLGNRTDVRYQKEGSKLTLFVNIPAKDSLPVIISYKGVYQGVRSANISEKNSWLLPDSKFYPMILTSDIYPERFTYNLRLTVPGNMKVVSSGKLISTTPEGDKKIFYYKADKPTPFISISAADYVINTTEYNGLKISTYLYPEDQDLKDTLLSTWVKVFNFYENKYGNYPYEEFNIVESNRSGGYGPTGFILLSKQSILSHDPQNEFILYHELAHQWWGNIVNPNKDGLMMSETMASYSVYSFWENEGVLNNPIDDPAAKQIPSILGSKDAKSTRSEFHRVAYHIAYEPEVIAEIDQDHHGYFYWGYHYKAVQGIKSLELFFGKENLDKAFKIYFNRYKFKSASLMDLVRIGEEVSGKHAEQFINDWFYTNKQADYRIADVETNTISTDKYLTRVTIKNSGEIAMPCQIALKEENGETILKDVNEPVENKAVIEAETSSKVVSVELDPLWKTMDAQRADNYYPQRYRFSFLIGLPAVTTNQFYYYPTVTYGLTDGIRPGLWITNILPVAGKILQRNEFPAEFNLGLLYGIKSSRVGYHFDFNTSAGMPSHYWKWGALAENVRGNETYGLNFSRIFYADYNYRRVSNIALSFERSQIYDLTYYDPLDYSKGIISSFKLSWQYAWNTEKINVNIENGNELLNGDYRFTRFSAEYKGESYLEPLSITYRGFAGLVDGTYPMQRAIFLSGSVLPSSVPYLFVDPDRKISTQEAIHTSGDADLRGYAGQHLRGEKGFGANIRIGYTESFFKYLNLFADAGNVWNDKFGLLKYDAGLGLSFPMIRLDFPFYVNQPEEGKKQFDFRFIFEVNAPF